MGGEEGRFRVEASSWGCRPSKCWRGREDWGGREVNYGWGTLDSPGRIPKFPQLSFLGLWIVSMVRKGWGEKRKSIRVTHRYRAFSSAHTFCAHLFYMLSSMPCEALGIRGLMRHSLRDTGCALRRQVRVLRRDGLGVPRVLPVKEANKHDFYARAAGSECWKGSVWVGSRNQPDQGFSYTNRVLEEKSSCLTWEQGRSRERREAVGSAGHLGTSNHIKLKKCPPPIFLRFFFFSF